MRIECTREDRDGGLPSLSDRLNALSKDEIRLFQIKHLKEIAKDNPEKAIEDAKKLNIDTSLIFKK